MSDDMIERVALVINRAICDELAEVLPGIVLQRETVDDESRRIARAAIEAMREPLREAHERWKAERGGIGFACHASEADRERAFAKADRDLAMMAVALLWNIDAALNESAEQAEAATKG